MVQPDLAQASGVTSGICRRTRRRCVWGHRIVSCAPGWPAPRGSRDPPGHRDGVSS